MAAIAAAQTVGRRESTFDGAQRPSYWYDMYGAHVWSELPLPFAPASAPTDTVPTWEFHHAEAWLPLPRPAGEPDVQLACCEIHRKPVVQLFRRPEGTIVHLPTNGTYRISPDARRVDVFPEEGVTERQIGFALSGAISVVVLHQLGYPTLHASAVVTDKGAVAFIGNSGQGKSSICASLLAAGQHFLTDDGLPLWPRPDGIYGAPSLPFMKLWVDSARCTLGLEELPSISVDFDKKLLDVDGRYPRVADPARLRALYLVDRYDPEARGTTECSVRRLLPRDAMVALLQNTSGKFLMSSLESARALRLYGRLVNQAPVKVLSFPSGYDYQTATQECIHQDLEQL